MLPGHKILLRYKTLDKCFRSKKKWTLEMLIVHCSRILDENISKRSIQSDIQFLRDNGAPVIVNDRKYYTYKDPNYSILKNKIPQKLEDQFIECIDFVKEISDFPKYKHYKDTLHSIRPRKDKSKSLDYVKFCVQQLSNEGFFTSQSFINASEFKKINNLVRYHKLTHKQSFIEDETLLYSVLNTKLKNLIKKINPRAFLVDAVYNDYQEAFDFKQELSLPMRQRRIPQNLTLWGYPAEEKHETPDMPKLFEETFIIQLFLKDVNCQTGALQVIPGSHQRELSPLEVKLITNNTFPSSCDVQRGGMIGYKPMLIQKVAPSESPKNKQSITLWFSSYRLPVHYLWNHEIYL
ncbi:hypothetical protein C7377_1574 [Balneicella halophila]|uniref:Uncharacterized protein n=1 Tax=Balneicella halophila TaxID=1537566 RepID=A0A7L4UN84_BALHA|nr:DUF2179 domain-containing protein [Balneicella halophila]PVX49935.1 hypothetical protein C7377_1574 [Balneicella halophila]